MKRDEKCDNKHIILKEYTYIFTKVHVRAKPDKEVGRVMPSFSGVHTRVNLNIVRLSLSSCPFILWSKVSLVLLSVIIILYVLLCKLSEFVSYLCPQLKVKSIREKIPK
jgi:hypothetical protein